ncbi:15391_t:CDS:2 [Acaulospora morrowiae]|uniref:15391_t:CDS:1 n=1 Tax=Acaulospora morrowiae TaxID=94023 RepID=A0A9N8Z9M6_9GLOM|nr:15391_t:CDS:2 [Acaulospora morrowiae]
MSRTYQYEKNAHLCTSIRYLDLAYCCSITNDVIFLITQSCLDLECLEIGECAIWPFLIYIIVKKLEYFYISPCSISDLAIKILCVDISENAVKKLNPNIKFGPSYLPQLSTYRADKLSYSRNPKSKQ